MEVEAGAVFVVPPVFFGCEDLAEGKQKQKDFFFQAVVMQFLNLLTGVGACI